MQCARSADPSIGLKICCILAGRPPVDVAAVPDLGLFESVTRFQLAPGCQAASDTGARTKDLQDYCPRALSRFSQPMEKCDSATSHSNIRRSDTVRHTVLGIDTLFKMTS